MGNVEPLRQDQPFRSIPHNVEAEQALLGALFVNNDALDHISESLRPRHFYEPIHRLIFQHSADLIRAGKKASPITVKTFLPEQKIAGMEPIAYLGGLVANAPTVVNAPDFANVILDLARYRAMIGLAEEMTEAAFEAGPETSPNHLIEATEKRLFELAETSKFGSGFEDFGTAIGSAIDMAAEAYKRDGHLSGIATGLNALDNKMGGLQKSDLIILAGRPAMGKTSLATNIAFNIAEAYQPEVQPDGTSKAINGGIVGFFSLEMAAEQLATRVISEQTEVSSSRIRRGEFNEAEFEKLVACSQMMHRIPLYIDQTGAISIAQLAARARRLKRQRGLDVVIIDYLQLMQGSGRQQNNRVQEITEITTGLKALAKELNVPIIALSQLSRQVENREDKRPQLSDLRESGSIEQDADVVMFVYREEYYLQNKEPDMGSPDYAIWQDKLDKARGKADAIIAKQRHGATGIAHLAFQPEFTRFTDLITDDHLPDSFE